jgi:hypothetical protein
MSATVRKSSPLAFTGTRRTRLARSSRLKPVAVPAEMQRPKLRSGLADQVAFMGTFP